MKLKLVHDDGSEGQVECESFEVIPEKPVSWGTCHFVSRRAALQYYRKQGEYADDLRIRFEEGSIKTGPPDTGPGQTFWADEDGRYHVRDMHFTELKELTRIVVDDTGNGRRKSHDQYAVVRRCGSGFKHSSAFAVFTLPGGKEQYTVVSVHSYLDVHLDDEEVAEIATDYMNELLSADLSPPRIMRG